MHYKDILVYVDRPERLGSQLPVAFALAARGDAHVTALHVEGTPEVPGYIVPSIGEEVLARLREAAKEETASVKQAVEAAAQAAGGRVEFVAVTGDRAREIERAARYADIVVMGQFVDGDVDEELMHDVVLDAGVPVLFVPAYGKFADVGRRVLVAWSGTREGARAVGDAMPLLVNAESVSALSVATAGDHRPTASDRLALHLSRHGVKVESTVDYEGEIGVGDILLSRAADMGADLIVMGAYGHSRLSESVFGGVTRHILEHMTVPVLMSH